MANEISTLPFQGDLVSVPADEEPVGDIYKFTTADAVHSTENCFTWEIRYADIENTQTAPTFSIPLGIFDSATPDGELGDLIENDHDRPPFGSFVFGPAYDGTCFILKDNLLHYCKPKQPEYWPSLYYIEVTIKQFPLITGLFHNGQPIVMSKNEMFHIQGSGHGTFFPFPLKTKTGAQSIRGAISVAGKGVFHTGPDGIYLYSSGNDSKITEASLEPLFRGETAQGMPGVSSMATAILHEFKNSLYFAYQSTGYNWPTNVLVINLETNKTSYYTYNDGAAVEIRAMTTDKESNRLLLGDNTGYVRVIESTSYTTDSGAAIPFEVQSKDFELQTRKHFPRWIKYDIDASSVATCTGELILNGESHHSHTITGSRNTKRRLVEIGNGNRSAIRISGTGPVTIYAAEGE